MKNLQLLYTYCIVLLSLTCIIPISLFAEYRIATVDIARVLNETSESKRAKADIDSASAKAKKQIESQRAALQKKEQKLREAKVKPDSSEADAFRKEAKEFSRFVKDTEEELRRKFALSNSKVTEKALKVVKQYAEDKSIDLILDKRSIGKGPVLFGTPHVDVTSEIIARMKG